MENTTTTPIATHQEVYFYIHCPSYYRKDKYVYGAGFADQADRKAFYDSAAGILQTLGWEKVIGDDSLMTKEKGEVHLHPQHISGFLKKSEIEDTAAALRTSATFSLEDVKRYEDVYDLTDEQYAQYLQSCTDELDRRLILEFRKYSKKQSGTGLYGEIVNHVASQFMLRRTGSFMGASMVSDESLLFAYNRAAQLIKAGKIRWELVLAVNERHTAVR